MGKLGPLLGANYSLLSCTGQCGFAGAVSHQAVATHHHAVQLAPPQEWQLG
jgi:hypothetical protein